ncbi:RPA-related protein RADX isoform X2 [Piliocolobus tephrosceles]|uniref:RPA1 related single stranded DNA binding protein, X-linked n=3 Tax=Cercopithecidae TaxID=9527 RepID=A0A2K6BMD9_MACNE|nr:RPA-related protein RADX isoform X2 [Piliocolobus tephrosceles]XP_025228216.1 RPA-related protein RADX isoform X2 [Theropithecus gelada]XP_028697570.1 RPA-related protein RADX isoform X1 [Macaca mulatta]XP_045239318.1 RPA-related protein RADX isoform X2 [Macaca fascicularis]XP_050631875.1 RPA-related protein RADX isoform X2 [Macaca thibetana thibetana]
MSGESGQPEAGPSHAGLDWPNPERNRAGVPGGVIRRAGAQGPRSWIQKVLEQIMDSPRQCVTPSEVVPVTVLAVQRYLLEDEPRDTVPKPPLYCYDVTISDGVYQEKCYLDPSLNSLVYQNILKVGIQMRISRVSCLYNEKRIGQGILCIDNVHCGETSDSISLETPFRNRAHQEKPERPLRGGKSHYLALWNNEDPYGDIWLTDKQPEEHNFSDTKIISLSHLEMTWTNRRNFPALLVRILHKSKLRYYGKPDKKMIEPYQTFLEVADSSGTVSVIMWNALCPEWYKSLRVGLVLLLQDYSVKKSYPFRIQPVPVDPQIKLISTMEICLNLRDPPTNIIIIPEKQVKPEWRLPKLNHRFTTRSELDDMPENCICDVIGLLVFVGRVQRSKKKENREDFWSYRWIHIADGTSEQPFIVELFSTSQPEIFENIYPMAYFVCTQLKVVRNDNQVPKLLYLTTTNESGVFITGHRGQPYTYDAKNANRPSTSQAARVEIQERNGKRHQDDEPVNSQYFQTTSTNLSLSNKIRILQGPHANPVAVPQPGASVQTKGIKPGMPSIFNRRANTNASLQGKARKTISDRWESQLWREKKFGLIDHLHYSHVYPESIPRKFMFEHRKFLSEQYNSQPAKYVPPEGRPPKLDDFKSARSLGHFEVTILGLNHEIAIDVAFLPMYCPEDIRTSQIDTLLTSMNYSCAYPQDTTGNDRLPGPRAVAGDIIKAATELDRVHIVGILDICNLGNNKVEVYLHKIYSPENTS